MNRILLETHEVGTDGRATLSGRRAEHVHGVLRASSGQDVRVGIINGPLGTASVRASHPDHLELQCQFDSSTPPRPRIDLLMAIPRPKALKRLYPVIAAMGIDRWWLVNAARVERDYFDTHVLEENFIRQQLILGLEQSGHTTLPVVSVRRRLKPFIEDELDLAHPPPEARLLLHPNAEAGIIRVCADIPASSRLLLAIGPEGGWVDFELELFKSHGFRTMRLGPEILRCDTAAIAALAILHEIRRVNSNHETHDIHES